MKKTRILLYFTLIMFVFAVLVVFTLWIVNEEVFFEDFEDEQAVQEYVLSTVTYGETTVNQVRVLIDEETYGDVECQPGTFEENSLVCRAPTGELWWYYVIRFVFNGNVLAEVSVSKSYVGL